MSEVENNEEKHGAFQEFLLPESYQRKVFYLKDRMYRGTWYVILAAAILQIGVVGIVWFQKKNIAEEENRRQGLEKQANLFADKKKKFSNIIDAYTEILKWDNFRMNRLLLGPILDSIEQTVPPIINLTEVNITQDGMERQESGKSLVGDNTPIADNIKNMSNAELKLLMKKQKTVFRINLKGVIKATDNAKGLIEDWTKNLKKVLPKDSTGGEVRNLDETDITTTQKQVQTQQGESEEKEINQTSKGSSFETEIEINLAPGGQVIKPREIPTSTPPPITDKIEVRLPTEGDKPPVAPK